MLVAWLLGVTAGILLVISFGVLIVALFWVNSIEKKWAEKYDVMHEAVGNLQLQIHEVRQFAGAPSEPRDDREIVGHLEGMERG